jgi:hypothetical protein
MTLILAAKTHPGPVGFVGEAVDFTGSIATRDGDRTCPY